MAMAGKLLEGKGGGGEGGAEAADWAERLRPLWEQLASAEAACVVSLVFVAFATVAVGPRSWWPYVLLLLWSAATGVAAVLGWVRFDCLAGACCGPLSSCGESSDLSAVLQLAMPGASTPEVSLEGLSPDDVAVVSGAIAEFGGRAGIERLAFLRCSKDVSEPAICGLLRSALTTPGLEIKSLDLSGNSSLGDGAVEELTSALARSEPSAADVGATASTGGATLQRLVLKECAITAAAITHLAFALSGSGAGVGGADFGGGIPTSQANGLEAALPPLAAEALGLGPLAGDEVPPPPPPPAGADVLRRRRRESAGAFTGEAAPPPPPPLSSAPAQLPPPLADPAERSLLSAVPASVAAGPIGAKGLRTLILSGNGLRVSGRGLARMLRSPALQELELARCGLSSEDISKLAAALPRSALLRLDLAGNNIASRELLALSAQLPASEVVDLGLEDNGIGRGSALAALAEACTKRPIPHLRLKGNRLSERELEGFLSSLRQLRPSRGGFGAAAALMAFCAPGCECNGRGEVM